MCVNSDYIPTRTKHDVHNTAISHILGVLHPLEHLTSCRHVFPQPPGLQDTQDRRVLGERAENQPPSSSLSLTVSCFARIFIWPKIRAWSGNTRNFLSWGRERELAHANKYDLPPAGQAHSRSARVAQGHGFILPRALLRVALRVPSSRSCVAKSNTLIPKSSWDGHPTRRIPTAKGLTSDVRIFVRGGCTHLVTFPTICRRSPPPRHISARSTPDCD